jgi:Kef-type K+ transport system membrane component KefB
MSNSDLALWMFFQLSLILCVVRAVGFLAQYIKQPRVVGEMIAGVVIGPSVLGHYAPSLQNWLFPKQTLPILYALSQIGLVLYMFLVGLEFNRKEFRSLARSAVIVSTTGIMVPFTLGALFVVSVFQYGGLFTENVSLPQAALFIGAAMSITAFPMLARIIKEHNLSGSPLGVLALAAGAADDAAAWCILAVVLSSFKNDYSLALSALVGGLVYGFVVLGVLMPLFSKLETTIALRFRSKGSLLGSTMTLVCLGAWFTDYVGIYAVFGAFILGIAIPRQHIGRELVRDIEPLASTLFLPLFWS